MNIEMVSQIIVVKKILKKTKTRFFQHLKVGDAFVIKKTLEQQSAASHGMYSVYLTCHRLDGQFPDESLSINEIMKATSLFQFIEKPFIALLKEEKLH